jgi:hypothetical protein
MDSLNSEFNIEDPIDLIFEGLLLASLANGFLFSDKTETLAENELLL